LKHTFEGSIAVRLRWCGDRAELEVADTGVGIPETERARLFDRFHRVKGARSRSHEGTGIGLALIKELVGLHRGTVRVESREGAGSTFIIAIRSGSAHLPEGQIGKERTLSSSAIGAAAYVEEALHWLPDATSTSSPPLPPAEAAEVGSTVTQAAAASSARPRILLADDNADMRNYVQRLLSDRYAVRAVPDGVAALAAAREEPPDLVLSDVMMPGLDGFGLLQELRKDERTRTIPVILLSARAGEEATVEGLGAGADDYVVKPFSARELLARVRTHLQIAQMRRAWARELEQSNKELEAFSYSVSHDLRAPLRWIDGFSQGLMEDCADTLDAGAQDKLRRIRAGVQHMNALIEGLLKLSRITRSELTRQNVDLSGMVREVASDLRRRDTERSLSLHIQDGLLVQGDPLLLRIALENLLQNAWKFTRKNAEATIEFNTTQADEGAVYCLRDNGAGFDMAHVDKLFSPFQRLHAAADFEGTGIGLATVARVVQRHGGRIWAEGKVNQGAAFYFTLESNN
ncbi:MAG TPA: ATP-binding protein, partial [Candidatus Polarisedimenticolia bacterium]